jgi:uncharacterized membrane protein
MNNQRIQLLPGRRRWLIVPIITVMNSLLAGCYYDKAELLYPDGAIDCSTVTATFVKVQSILTSKCNTSGCHNTRDAAGGTVLETYDQAKEKAGRINQRAIVEKTMPPGTALTSSETAILKCWINSGTPNN